MVEVRQLYKRDARYEPEQLFYNEQQWVGEQYECRTYCKVYIHGKIHSGYIVLYNQFVAKECGAVGEQHYKGAPEHL